MKGMECQVSFRGNKSVLQLDSHDGYLILNTLKVTELCALKWGNFMICAL